MALQRLQLLVLSIVATTAVLASAFPVYENPGFKHPHVKPVHHYSHSDCAPLDLWYGCALFIEDSELFKGPHKQWQPEADYHSLCCQLVRDESADCMCKAVSATYAHMKIDLDRAMYLPQWCKKEVAQGTKCAGKEVKGYVPEKNKEQYVFGGHY